MGVTFLEFMKSVGIFILCAQSFMHFAAGNTYEKYVRLLVGVMVLAQFIVPVRAVFLGRENAWIWDEIERFQKELETVAQEAGMAEGEGREAGVSIGIGAEKKALEEEVKERLTGIAGSYGLAIEEVELQEDPPKIIVAVCYGEVGEMAKGKIKVEKIIVRPDGGSGQDIEDMPEGAGKATLGLAEAFSEALGTDAGYVEVVMEP